MTAPDPSIELMRLVTGAWAARLVHTAVELGIADHLAGTPRPVGFLAAQTGAHAPSLARLLRALTAIGVLRKAKSGCTALPRLVSRYGATCPALCARGCS